MTVFVFHIEGREPDFINPRKRNLISHYSTPSKFSPEGLRGKTLVTCLFAFHRLLFLLSIYGLIEWSSATPVPSYWFQGDIRG